MSNAKKKGLSQFLYEQRKKNNEEEEEKHKKEQDVERILVQSKHIGKDVAIAGYQKKEMPYKKIEFKSLVDYAVDVVAANFHRYPDLSGIHDFYKQKIVEKLSKTMSLRYTAGFVDDEKYWEQACNRWPVNNLPAHGNSWKQLYIEKHVEEAIGSIKNPDQLESLFEEFKFAKNYVFNLRIDGMHYPMDMKLILSRLPVLNNVQIRFGPKHVGFEYKKQAFGMKIHDAANLGDALRNNLNLLSMNLSGNLIDDELMKLLMNGLTYNRSLVDLDLSHNRIGDYGAKRIAKFFKNNEILLNLDLSDNLIGYEGSRFIALALQENTILQNLNLKMNNIGDQGGTAFFKDLIKNTTLESLGMAANALGDKTVEKLCDYVSDYKCALKSLDMSSNKIHSNCYEKLRGALQKNTSLERFDIRANEMKEEQQKDLVDIITKQYLHNRNIPYRAKSGFEEKMKKLLDEELRKKREIAERKKQEQGLMGGGPQGDNFESS